MSRGTVRTMGRRMAVRLVPAPELDPRDTHAMHLEAVELATRGIIHDVSSLLTGIVLTSEALTRGQQPDRPAGEDLRAIQTCARQASEILRSLTRFLRDDDEAEELDTAELLATMRPVLFALAQRRAEITWNIQQQLPEVTAAPAHLRRILTTLVLNAVEALDGPFTVASRPTDGPRTVPSGHGRGLSPGSIRISNGRATLDRRQLAGLVRAASVEPGDFVFLEVQDDGRGMDLATQRAMFVPHVASPSTGAGLGFAVLRHFVSLYGGAIGVDSAPGEGTTIRVYFPVKGSPGGGDSP